MESQTLKMLTFAAAGAAALTIAPAALACEDCLSDPNSNGGICWSGFDSGAGSCWGGGDQWCQLEGNCSMPANMQACPGDPNYFWYSYCEQQSWNDYFCWGWGWCES
jgi:hypothetical protein